MVILKNRCGFGSAFDLGLVFIQSFALAPVLAAHAPPSILTAQLPKFGGAALLRAAPPAFPWPKPYFVSGPPIGGKGVRMAQIEVFHDGGCPVCRVEIAFYRRVDKAARIAWTDILSLGDADLPSGKSRAELLGRFHVREHGATGGNWHVGVDAFARIWRELPVFRHLAWVFSVPGIRQLAEIAYLAFVRSQARRRASEGVKTG